MIKTSSIFGDNEASEYHGSEYPHKYPAAVGTYDAAVTSAIGCLERGLVDFTNKELIGAEENMKLAIESLKGGRERLKVMYQM